MFSYKITCNAVNLDGSEEEVTKTLYFNLTQGDMVKLNLEKNGKLEELLKEIEASKDTEAMLKTFETIILTAYGVKDADGFFVKNQKYTDRFAASEEYSEFFIKLVTEEINPVTFLLEIMPKKIATEVAAKMGINK